MTFVSHLRRETSALIALAVPFAASAACGRALPDATFGAALSGVGLYAGLIVLPLIDPIQRIRWDAKPLPILRLASAVVSTAAALFVARALFDGDPDAARRISLLAMVALLTLIGNALPALPPNLFIGIRLPWTLRDHRVWAQTHRIAGHGLIAISLGLAALWPLFDTSAYQTLTGIAFGTAAVAILVYSWLLSRRPA